MHVAVACLAIAMATSACRNSVESRRPASARVSIALPGLDIPAGPLIANLTRTRLIRLDQAGMPQAGLIEKWTTSDDHLTWTLRVRECIQMQDGRIATASDALLLIEDAVKAGDSVPGLWDVTSVEQAGPREIRLRVKRPTSLLLDSLSLVPAVPSGPFRAVNQDAREPNFEAVPQPGQPGGDVGHIFVRRYDTPRSAVAALLREEVDVLYEVPNESRDHLETEEGVHVYPHIKPYVVTLGLNHRHPILARREVRLAMNAAIDREMLIAQVAEGVGVPAAAVLWHGHWSRPHATDAEALRVDRDRASRLLDEAGLTRRTRGGTVEPRFRVKCLVLDDPMMHRVAGRLQQAYGEIGIALDLQVIGLEEMVTRLDQGQFEAFVSPMVSGYGLAIPYLYFGSHKHPRMTDLGYTAAAPAAERVRAASSDAELADAIAAFHKVLIEDPPAVTLFWQETSRAVGRRITVPSGWTGDVLGSLPRWTVRTDAP